MHHRDRLRAVSPTRLPSIPTRSMLEGLAQIHPFVLAIDSGRRVAWMSDELGVVFAGGERLIGRPFNVLLEKARAEDALAFHAQIHDFVAELRRTRNVGNRRFDLESASGLVSIEVSGFEVNDEAGETLLVFIAHPLKDAAPLASRRAPIDSDSQLAFILDTTPDGVLTVDPLGVIRSANAAAGAFLGHAPEELVDHPLSRFVTDTNRAVELATELFERGELESTEIEIRRADGGRAWLSVSARTRTEASRPHAVQSASSPAPVETVVFIRDVTERHEARELLERKNDELETYVSSVSHDLRSPLVSLLGFTRLLRDDYGDALAETGRHFLDRIEQAGLHMEQLLHDMLELSRISETPQCHVRVDPRPVLLQLEAELKLRLDEKNIELSLPGSPPTILCDRTRLYQLLSNLVGNAIAHMEPRDRGEESGHIQVAIDTLDSSWRISVRDDGPGIAPEDQARIFEMFQTAGRPTGHKRSSGLGLAIVKKIVETHGGRVWVESEPGQGACFFVDLPNTAVVDLPNTAVADLPGS